jgi:hypothetical protein
MLDTVKKLVGGAFAAAALAWAPAAHASLITFDITWSNSYGVNAAGVLTLDSTQFLYGTGLNYISIDKIQELTVTLTGAVSGNGVYDKSNYKGIYFESATQLDLSKELIGQTVTIHDWHGTYTAQYGVIDDGRTGGLDLIGTSYSVPSSVAAWKIISGTDGEEADLLYLTSILARPGSVDAVQANAVPEPETYALLLAGLGVVVVGSRRARANKTPLQAAAC